jgi:hypothetical protein
LCRSSFLKHVIEGKVEKREAMGRRGRGRKHVLDDHKENTTYWNLKEEALVYNLRRACLEGAKDFSYEKL